ncbi:hypothetical protein PPROV_000735700 [Pycnococcus provasolii]|uniref:Thioesterase domain-containing protein n=1 Tax=Pycnococcus provasolii TaxID=41880 RepID=A0A830HS94_9CHLO|nr:hypothetical protein PPROV_000735700 [Pycnococcus provasolii]
MAWDEWIATYVDAIKTKQKGGPYTLVGYSQGMHWCYAVGEALRKKGDQVAEMIILDPNFPAWNFADRVAKWDGPQVAAAMGAPQFVAKTFMGCFMVPSLKKGAKWETAAAREKTVSTALAAMDQIEEHIFKMDTKCKPGSVDAKWKGMMVAFELHFRFMHAPTIWEQLKTNIWTKIGML